MPDPFVARLSALAPTVDMTASRSLFDRHRVRPAATRRWLLPAAVITLLIAGVVGVWALARPEGTVTAPVATVDDPSDGQPDQAVGSDDYQLLAVGRTTRAAGTVEIATTTEQRDDALDAFTDERIEVTTDMSRSIIVVLNVAGNSCPYTLDGFDVVDAVWSPRLVESGRDCNDIGLTWAYVVAIDRDRLGSGVTFRLPPESGGGEATANLDLPATDVPADGPATGDEFVMLAVEATQLEFGSILVANDGAQFDQMWAETFAGAEQPPVDFDHLVAVAFTLPDDACPDILTNFAIERPVGEGPTIWEPQFEPPPGGCRVPLITRTYVVGIDRSALDYLVTFRLPGSDVYDFDTTTVTFKFGGSGSDPEPAASPTLTPTGVRVPLPPVGEPRIAVGTFGIVWVVQHDDGTVSVLDAVIDRRVGDDEGGVTGLAHLVVPTATGDGFSGAFFVWDSHGRSVNGPRTSDLTGFAGEIVDDEVELFLSDATTIAGVADRVTGEFVPPDLDAIPLVDLGTLPKLSFSGPIWRQLDATLVVENGVGTLCSIDQDVPVPDLATCNDGVATAMRATQPEFTSWFFGPVLAEFDEFGEIVTVAPLGGSASRNDSAVEPTETETAVIPGDFDVLWVGPSDLSFGTLFGTSTSDELGTWLSARNARVDGPQPIDFDRSIALVVAMPGDACPDALTGFSATGDRRLTPIFVPPDGGCRGPLVARTYVVAIDRAALPNDVVFQIPADESYGYDEATVVLDDVGGSPGAVRDLVGRPGPGDPAVTALGVTIDAVVTECPIAAAPMTTVTATADRPIDVLIDVIARGTVRGSTRTTLSPGSMTAAPVTLSNGRLDAGQQVVLRSAASGAIVRVVDHVGCG
jgi:hypothetical protein